MEKYMKKKIATTLKQLALTFCHLLLTLTFAFPIAWPWSLFGASVLPLDFPSLFAICCFVVPVTLPVHIGFLAVTWTAINHVLKHSCVASAYMVKRWCSQLYPWIRLRTARGSQCERHEGTKARGGEPWMQVAWFAVTVIRVSFEWNGG